MTKEPQLGKILMYCSFCGKSQDEIAKLIAGPSVYICDECVGLCNEILDEEDTKPAKAELPTASLSERTTESLQDALSGAANIAQHLDARLKATVLELKDRGKTWADIGGLLGTTRQAAWERVADDD